MYQFTVSLGQNLHAIFTKQFRVSCIFAKSSIETYSMFLVIFGIGPKIHNPLSESLVQLIVERMIGEHTILSQKNIRY